MRGRGRQTRGQGRRRKGRGKQMRDTDRQRGQKGRKDSASQQTEGRRNTRDTRSPTRSVTRGRLLRRMKDTLSEDATRTTLMVGTGTGVRRSSPRELLTGTDVPM